MSSRGSTGIGEPLAPDWVVACAQMPARELAQADRALEEALAAVDQAALAGADLVLLPECTYPAYFLADLPLYRDRLRPQAELLELFARKARDRRVYVAMGLALETEGTWHNSLVLFDRTGRLLHRADKRLLWHFDSCWFAAGGESAPVETEFGRLGLLICADGRLPEIPRCLALQGAGYLLDATAWVASGSELQELRNAQADYMMEVRARESGVYLAAANKVGVEARAVRYCGKSLVAGPDGRLLAWATPDRPEILYARLPRGHRPAPEVRAAAGPVEYPQRRPSLYRPLVKREIGPVAAAAAAPATAAEAEGREAPGGGAALVAAISARSGSDAEGRRSGQPSLEALLESTEALLRVASWMGARLVVLPDFGPVVAPEEAGWEVAARRVEALEAVLLRVAGERGLALVYGAPARASGRWYAGVTAVDGGRVMARYHRAHLLPQEQGLCGEGDEAPPVFRLAGLAVGLMGGPEGLLPEVARLLTLEGAQILAWPCGVAPAGLRGLARSRAAENRVFVVAAELADPWGGGQGLICGPAGAPLSATVPEVGLEVASALIVPAEASVKAVAPGTDVVADRHPWEYGPLVRAAGGEA